MAHLLSNGLKGLVQFPLPLSKMPVLCRVSPERLR